MNRRSKLFAAVIPAAVVFGLAGCATAPPEQAGPTTDQRLNTATRALHSDIQELRDEVKELRNQLEVKSYEIDQLKARMDSTQNGVGSRRPRRFGQLRRPSETTPESPDAPLPAVDGFANSTQASGATTSEPAPGAADAASTGNAPSQRLDNASGGQAVDPGRAQADAAVAPTGAAPADNTQVGGAQAAYDQAFNLLKQSRFNEAYQAFQSFLSSYPNSPLADNAQYWSGEALYAERQFDRAVGEFDKVVLNYPDSDKAPEAMLKKGYSYYELGDMASAEAALNEVIAKYPGARVSVSAQNRLTQIASDKRQQGAGQ